MDCRERLEDYLEENGVDYRIMAHEVAYTMPEVAAELHVPGKHVAKVVMIKAAGRIVMMAVPASYRVDLKKAKEVLDVDNVSLADEEEFTDLFPDCEVGAMPPFGNLYDVPVYVDSSLAEEKEIVFQAGTHGHAMRMSYADFARLVEPIEGRFAHPM